MVKWSRERNVGDAKAPVVWLSTTSIPVLRTSLASYSVWRFFLLPSVHTRWQLLPSGHTETNIFINFFVVEFLGPKTEKLSLHFWILSPSWTQNKMLTFLSGSQKCQQTAKNIFSCLGDSMSMVRGKRLTLISEFFFYEMQKIIGQIDDLTVFFNSCNLGVFLAKNQKYPKMTVLKKWKLKKKRKKN